MGYNRGGTLRGNFPSWRDPGRLGLMTEETKKQSGAYYTPPEVVRVLVGWAVRGKTDRLLDPSCGDGRFVAAHSHTVGIEQDADAVQSVRQRAPKAVIHEGDFFAWANNAHERFDAAVGNPPFIRYQRFSGDVRNRALQLCSRLGAPFTALTSSWAPFLVVAASLLRPGGRMAFVVPAEVGHATYAEPLLRYLFDHFGHVEFVAIRERIFSDLSEDVWLLFADRFGESTAEVYLRTADSLRRYIEAPVKAERVSSDDWRRWNFRLRPFLLPSNVRDTYQRILGHPSTKKLADVARVGIGYVTGANDFFHLRPSEAAQRRIPTAVLHPAVRNGRMLVGATITKAVVAAWLRHDEPVLLLRLSPGQSVPVSVQRYLDIPEGRDARSTYKCRNRDPWYCVPDIIVPDAFLSYMSGDGPTLVSNAAGCVGTNSVHTVRLNGKLGITELRRLWSSVLTRLSCEVEGHPLGGGMLKVEPGEAQRAALAPAHVVSKKDAAVLAEGIASMRRWRHYGGKQEQS